MQDSLRRGGGWSIGPPFFLSCHRKKQELKKIIFFAIGSLIGLCAFAQTVQWKFSSKSLGDNMYELHMTASIEAPWHLYSQTTQEGGPVPTEFKFNLPGFIMPVGIVEEKGKMIIKKEEVFGIDVKYYGGIVDFVQVIRIKTKIKTNIIGSVKYMVCNDRECLPPRTESFSINIGYK